MGAPSRASKSPAKKAPAPRAAAAPRSAPKATPARASIEAKPAPRPAPAQAAAPAAKPKPRALEGAEAVKAVLHDATPKARELAETLRRLVKKAAPDAAESADLRAGSISFERKKPFCTITPGAEHVVFAFHRGSDLDDPESILAGSGKGARTIRVAQVHDIRGGAFERFVRQARELAAR